jgi:hypothetical protein
VDEPCDIKYVGCRLTYLTRKERRTPRPTFLTSHLTIRWALPGGHKNIGKPTHLAGVAIRTSTLHVLNIYIYIYIYIPCSDSLVGWEASRTGFIFPKHALSHTCNNALKHKSKHFKHHIHNNPNIT